MIDQLAEKLALSAIASGVVNKNDREIFIYGYQSLIEKVLSWGSIFVVSIFFHMFPGALAFLLFFVPLRSYAGGCHARTVFSCYLISVVSFAAFCFLVPIISNVASNPVCHLFLVICTIVILILAPIADENKPITITEAKRYKIRTITILAVEIVIISICINLPSARTILFFMLYALFMISISLIVAFKKKKKTILTHTH